MCFGNCITVSVIELFHSSMNFHHLAWQFQASFKRVPRLLLAPIIKHQPYNPLGNQDEPHNTGTSFSQLIQWHKEPNNQVTFAKCN